MHSTEPGRPPSVDCAINVCEKTYRPVLEPGALGFRYAQHSYPFGRRLLTINNVRHRRHAAELAEAALRRGECDEYIFIEDYLDVALEVCGLTRRDLGAVAHYVDHHLVKAAYGEAEYLVVTTEDIELAGPFDWISTGIEALSRDTTNFACNPDWAAYPGAAAREALRYDDPFYIGFGFSDQCFLALRSNLAKPIYKEWNRASDRYPMSAVGRIFEARIDAYMRNHGLLRLTDSRVAYYHRNAYPEGTYNVRASRRSRLARLLGGIVRAGSAEPGGPGCD